jgi:hypothetical protein
MVALLLESLWSRVRSASARRLATGRLGAPRSLVGEKGGSGEDRRRAKKKIRKGGTHGLEQRVEGLQEWRLRRKFGGICKIKAYLEVLLNLIFLHTQPLNFGLEVHMKGLAGVALSRSSRQ